LAKKCNKECNSFASSHYLKKKGKTDHEEQRKSARENGENGKDAATKENFSKIILVAQVECSRVEVKEKPQNTIKKKEKQKNQAAGIKKALNTLSIIIPHSRAYSWLFNNFGVSVLFATLRAKIQ